MNWKKTCLVLSGLLAVSLFIHILSFSGCLGGSLIREKDVLVTRFEKQIHELEAKNKTLGESLTALQARLNEYAAAHAWAGEELQRILKEYSRLKTE
jgi:hypothetical protein